MGTELQASEQKWKMVPEESNQDYQEPKPDHP